VSIRPLRLSQVGFLRKRLNMRSYKQNRTIAKGLKFSVFWCKNILRKFRQSHLGSRIVGSLSGHFRLVTSSMTSSVSQLSISSHIDLPVGTHCAYVFHNPTHDPQTLNHIRAYTFKSPVKRSNSSFFVLPEIASKM